MITYFFYNKGAADKESIGTTKATDKEEATDFFAEVKNLSTEDFLELYEVEEK